ncbi:hypothetical protein PGT21_016190 [Puccinia graminis f. sp. tritici]|uniref:PEBP-like protein n=1 Tax=Puccinia graminis f. sp. tritici TaxID=56615 RepID=A0A5B0LVB5_PUCGR|nr:hypothetical protein PGT21_016190 [Puccinia graminis f. sp. tritici]KAA1093505.1 hypothetical protein PGTUg99_023486 [Puccinia graminis f. sp. tritici]
MQWIHSITLCSLLFQFIAAQSPGPGPPAQPTQTDLSEVKQAFIREGIVPDVLTDFDPQLMITVVYPPGSTPTDTIVQPGQRIPEKLAGLPPRVLLSVPQSGHLTNLTHATPDSAFTFFILDPDAPSRRTPSAREFLHMMATDVRLIPLGRETPWRYELDISGGRVAVPYMSPQPPPGTGPHRYVFLLCPGIIPSIAPLQGPNASRADFKAQKFIAQSAGLHPPIAGTFVQIQHTHNDP